jgi:hypothetical protein
MERIKKYLIILIITVTAVNIAYGQKNIKWKTYKKDLKERERVTEGYIVTNSNDTIYGLIEKYNEMFDYMQYSEIYFRDTVKRQETTVTPEHIKMYWLNGEPFFKKTIGTGIFSSDVFMKELIKGNTSLFFYIHSAGDTDPDIMNSYIAYNSSPRYYIEKGINLIEVKRKGLSKQMTILLKECNSLNTDIKFNETALVKLINDYNNCVK